MKSSFFDNTVRLHIGHFAPLSPLFAASHEVFCHQPSIKCISAQIVINQVAIDSISMEDSDFEPDTPLGKRAAAQKSKGEEAAVDLTVSDEEDVVYVTEVKSDPIPSSSAAADDQNMVIFDDAQEIGSAFSWFFLFLGVLQIRGENLHCEKKSPRIFPIIVLIS